MSVVLLVSNPIFAIIRTKAISKTLWLLFWQSAAFIQNYHSGIKYSRKKIFRKEKIHNTARIPALDP